jgi:hypothetical protein
MVFLAPVMLYPGAVGLSGLVRLVRWHGLSSVEGQTPDAARGPDS